MNRPGGERDAALALALAFASMNRVFMRVFQSDGRRSASPL